MTSAQHLVATRHRIGRAVRLAAIATLANIPAGAQSTVVARDSFQDAVKASIQPIIQAICDAADEKDRAVCRTIEFRIADRGESSGATPFATLIDGQPIVELPLVHIRELLLLNESIVVEVILPRPDFAETYGRRLAALRRENNRRIAAGQPPEEMPLPLDVAEADDATRARVKADPRMAATARNLYEAGVAFIVAVITCTAIREALARSTAARAWHSFDNRSARRTRGQSKRSCASVSHQTAG
jgi:hypothetical protein